jgi:hypothetical protein
MRRIVLTFGLIAGAILSIMMAITMPFHEKIGFDNGMIIGYTTMVVAFLMVYFGIKSYRENVANGEISFGRAFKVGLLITLIASTCYVLTWQVIQRVFPNDFMAQWTEYTLEKERAAGASEATLTAKRAEMEKFQEMYRNPLINMAMTLAEVLPVGLLMTVVSAAVLRRRANGSTGAAQLA